MPEGPRKNLRPHCYLSAELIIAIYYEGFPRNAVSADFLEPVCTGGHLITSLGFSANRRACTPKQEKVPI